MIKKTVILLLTAAMSMCFAGCYDMVDIEDIASVAVICVDNTSITYCVVASSAGEKKYSVAAYTYEGDSLYHGMEKVSQQTGKKVSLSHMEAVLFSNDCTHQRVKTNINALLGSTNSHPKAMTAFYTGNTAELLKNLSDGDDAGLSERIKRLMDNPYAGSMYCTAMDLCYGVNFEGGGVAIPVIGTGDSGDFEFCGNAFANENGILHTESQHQAVFALISSVGEKVYPDARRSVSVTCTKFDAKYNKQDNKVIINADFVYDSSFGGEADEKALSDAVKSGLAYIADRRNDGFDILNIQAVMKKSFLTVPQWERYIAQKGGINNAVADVQVSFNTSFTDKNGQRS